MFQIKDVTQGLSMQGCWPSYDDILPMGRTMGGVSPIALPAGHRMTVIPIVPRRSNLL